jgi:predicted nucleic acid-binding protein
MIAVLDASAGIASVLRRPGVDPILGALREASQVLAPELYTAEVTNAFWKYQQFGDLTAEGATELCEDALALPDALVDIRDQWRETLNLALFERATAYDMFYLCLARRNGAVLLSVDRKMLKLAKRHRVKCLGST